MWRMQSGDRVFTDAEREARRTAALARIELLSDG